MRKHKKILETKEVLEVINTWCNKCGKSIYYGSKSFGENCGLVEAIVHAGYHSPLFFDMSAYRFSLCEYCLDKLFKTFKVPVEYRSEETFQKYIPINKVPKSAKKYYQMMDKLNKLEKEYKK